MTYCILSYIDYTVFLPSTWIRNNILFVNKFAWASNFEFMYREVCMFLANKDDSFNIMGRQRSVTLGFVQT